MNIKYINNLHTTKIHKEKDVTFITFDILDDENIIHGFSTRLGGVSKDYLGSMNLSFHRGDDNNLVMENHKRFADALGYDYRNLVFSDQIHETKIRIVDKSDCGKGILKDSDIIGYDGLVTNVAGIPLITFYADCVPIYFYDPIKLVVGMAHSGWRGTVKKISQNMINTMIDTYGSKVEDIICAIGPSICQDCYEVSKDVIDEFNLAFGEDIASTFSISNGNDKYQLDLHKANKYILEEAGILSNHIAVTDLCTCCNSDLLFSHRASHGKRGNLAGVIMIK